MTRRLLIGCAAIAVLAVLRPWTIQPIDGAPPAVFSAAEYVTGLWDTSVREAITAAIPITSVNIQSFPPGAKSLLVQGDGDVTSVDSSSLVGVAHVRFTDAIEADVLVGPVIRGTAIRDALRFIRFSDFANQIEYAQVASSLNERVLDQLRNVPQPALLVGRRVRIVGALATGGSRWEITPLTIDVSGGAK